MASHGPEESDFPFRGEHGQDVVRTLSSRLQSGGQGHSRIQTTCLSIDRPIRRCRRTVSNNTLPWISLRTLCGSGAHPPTELAKIAHLREHLWGTAAMAATLPPIRRSAPDDTDRPSSEPSRPSSSGWANCSAPQERKRAPRGPQRSCGGLSPPMCDDAPTEDPGITPALKG